MFNADNYIRVFNLWLNYNMCLFVFSTKKYLTRGVIALYYFCVIFVLTNEDKRNTICKQEVLD